MVSKWQTTLSASFFSETVNWQQPTVNLIQVFELHVLVLFNTKYCTIIQMVVNNSCRPQEPCVRACAHACTMHKSSRLKTDNFQLSRTAQQVTLSLADSLTHSVRYFYFCHTKSNPRDLLPLRHLIRVMRRHDLSEKVLPNSENLKIFQKSDCHKKVRQKLRPKVEAKN